MSVLTANILPFLFNWLILFVACFAIVEYGQTYFYDEATPSAALKVAAGSAILALILTWTKTSYDTMLTSEIFKTVLLALAGFLVFTFVFRFHPWHGAAIGIVTVLLLGGISTMGVDSLKNRNRPLPSESRHQARPIRKTTPLPSAAPKAP